MKKFIIAMMLLLSFSTYSQVFLEETTDAPELNPYTQWAISGEYGTHDVSDESARLLTDRTDHSLKKGHHWGLNVRYNFNPKFGLGLNYGKDNIALESFEGVPVELDYTRLNAEMYINVFQILDLQNNVFTMIVHGGPGISFIRTDNNYDQNLGNFSGGLTPMFKINKWLALKVDWTSTGNFSQQKTLDGEVEITNKGINSVVHNLSVGATFYLGKKDKDGNRREHADWVIPVEKPTVVNTYVTSPIIETIRQVEIVTVDECVYHQEYVFFDHDKSDFRDSELNAVFKVFTELEANPNFTLVIKAYASPTSSSDEYNQDLSQRRSSVILDKFLAMGIDGDRITTESFGKDHGVDDEKSVFDTARRVELIVNRTQE